MEKIDIICVGGMKEKFMRDMCAEYQKRLSRFCKVTVTELAEYRLPDSHGAAQIERALDIEGEAILSQIADGTFSVALCVEGNKLSSESFSKKLEDGMRMSGRAAFIIGSSYGLSPKVKSACDMRLSMSDMTFPHQLARCVLFEQIYRAYKIRFNQSYHK